MKFISTVADEDLNRFRVDNADAIATRVEERPKV